MKEVQYIKINEIGSKFYFKDKKMSISHRTDGPAKEFANGDKLWWVNGKLHRTAGPAYEDANGNKEWYVNGKLHRTDGPAVEWADGTKFWYIDGVELTKEEFKHEMQPKININGKDFTIEELNELIGAVKGK